MLRWKIFGTVRPSGPAISAARKERLRHGIVGIDHHTTPSPLNASPTLGLGSRLVQFRGFALGRQPDGAHRLRNVVSSWPEIVAMAKSSPSTLPRPRAHHERGGALVCRRHRRVQHLAVHDAERRIVLDAALGVFGTLTSSHSAPGSPS